MSDAAWLALWANLPGAIAAIGALIASIVAAIVSLRSERKSDDNAAVLKQGQKDIKQATDGMKDALVAAEGRAGEQRGKEKEQANPTTESVPITGDSRRSSDQ